MWGVEEDNQKICANLWLKTFACFALFVVSILRVLRALCGSICNAWQL